MDYTKGKWEACELLRDGAYGAFCIIANDMAIADIFVCPEAEANAHLIAAASDMYEALQWVTQMASHSSTDSQVILMAIKALAKAEGEPDAKD